MVTRVCVVWSGGIRGSLFHDTGYLKTSGCASTCNELRVGIFLPQLCNETFIVQFNEHVYAIRRNAVLLLGLTKFEQDAVARIILIVLIGTLVPYLSGRHVSDMMRGGWRLRRNRYLASLVAGGQIVCLKDDTVLSSA